MIFKAPEVRQRKETSQYGNTIRNATTFNLLDSDENVKGEYDWKTLLLLEANVGSQRKNKKINFLF